MGLCLIKFHSRITGVLQTPLASGPVTNVSLVARDSKKARTSADSGENEETQGGQRQVNIPKRNPHTLLTVWWGSFQNFPVLTKQNIYLHVSFSFLNKEAGRT